MCVKRRIAQIRILKHDVLQTFEEEENDDDDEDYLTRDEFNLHKMVIAVSKAGKVSAVPQF